jgi:nucleoside 2-deoxyribosyltransferase
MKLIYIAGPFSNDDNLRIEVNILKAKKAMRELLKKGWAVICPHANTAGFQHENEIEDSIYYSADLEMLKRCDAVFMLKDWKHSHGAVNEHLISKQNNISIYYEIDGYPKA